MAVPPVQRHGSAVLFCGPAIVDLNRILPNAVAAAARLDGIAVPARWREILAAVRDAAAMSACPATDVREEPASPQWLTTRETAELLNVSERHVRRTARQLGGYRGRGGWVFARTEVEATAQRKAAA